MNVILTRGLPGSGKSTWAKKQMEAYQGKVKRVNKDLLREMVDCGKWSPSNEKFIIKVRDALILQYLDAGFNVIVDDCNFGSHEIHIRSLVAGKAYVMIQDFTDVSLEDCIARDLARPNHVGETVIRRMYNQYLRPMPPVVKYDSAKEDAVLCDLDGTLALFGDKNPYNRDFINDEVNDAVRSILTALNAVGHNIVITSGRTSAAREETIRWLAKHSVPFYRLHMRNVGDTRKDSVVKREMYETHIAPVYNVRFVLDDRDQVVELWRSLGLTCLQVAEGDF